jgi:hypothetical protein
MKTNSCTRSAFFTVRALIGFLFCFAGALLALFASGAFSGRNAERPARYMPVPGIRQDSESADLGRLERFWNDRLTYPTGRFDPRWLRAAAAQHARLPIGVPAGVPAVLNPLSPLALSTSNFIALGPQPERMTGCSGCLITRRPKGE